MIMNHLGWKKNKKGSNQNNPTTFRDNFRGTRVFVQGIPKSVSWQTLKDHFRIAGNVVFASVSIDRVTNESKGQGIVQFETVEEAENAIQVMRHHPLEDDNGESALLYVRHDHQQNKELDSAYSPSDKGRSRNQYQQRTIWRCANDDEDNYLSMEDQTLVLNIIKARDASRKRRNYDAADAMREKLKQDYNVHLDDRLKLWWKDMSMDGDSSAVPDKVHQIKGTGHWKNKLSEKQDWRQIATTPEKDACVDPNLVQALLTQRDIARAEKDFYTADNLLEQALYSPTEDGYILRIHDESRTWRVWSEEPPQQKVRVREGNFEKGAVEQCMELVKKHNPEKKEEVLNLLKKFPGREYNILRKLKQKYTEDGLY